jgi:hypothetical protein
MTSPKLPPDHHERPRPSHRHSKIPLLAWKQLVASCSVVHDVHAAEVDFPPEDEQWASAFVTRGEVRVIPGIWGHLAGRGANPKDSDVIGDAIRNLLARPAATPPAH